MTSSPSLSIMQFIGADLPFAWEPAETAPDNVFPVVVHAVEPRKGSNVSAVMLAGSRIDGEWCLLGEIPENHIIVEYFRLSVPPSLLEGMGN